MIMNKAELRALADWIAHDKSDFAQRCRAVLRPVVTELTASVLRFERWTSRFDHSRRAIRRRKIRKVVFP